MCGLPGCPAWHTPCEIKSDPQMVLDEINEHVKLFMVYHRQTGSGAVEVRSWGIEKYLDVMESFRIVTCIKPPEEEWLDI